MNVRSRTTRGAEEEVVDLLREVHGLMKAELRERAEEMGLPPFTRHVVVLLRVTREPGITMNELGRLLTIPKSQISQLVADLVRDGLVRKVEDREDQRLVRVLPTAAGRREADRWRGAYRTLVGRHVQLLSDQQVQHLVEGLRALQAAYRPAQVPRTA
ncbi:MAG TPA: helix-turn-helix domain-containing protein [Actinomycetota bacterium]|nr:helix-turn-helix domain-containing protein [Actinomycetota bacterium]